MARITEEEYQGLLKKRPTIVRGAQDLAAKPSKYRNVKKEWNGLVFDSTKELRRYQDLLAQQMSGQIESLGRQEEFPLVVEGYFICGYVADFVYYRDGVLVVEDVKSKFTRKLPVYSLKKKLMKAVRGIEITEI